MRKKLFVTIIGMICLCMSGCVATTNSEGDNVNDEIKSETPSDVKTEKKEETNTIIYEDELNSTDEYYDNEMEYEEDEEEFYEDLDE